MRHWPERLLVALFLLGSVVPQLCYRGWNPLIRIALGPAGWLVAFGVWVAIIWAYWRIYKKD